MPELREFTRGSFRPVATRRQHGLTNPTTLCAESAPAKRAAWQGLGVTQCPRRSSQRRPIRPAASEAFNITEDRGSVPPARAAGAAAACSAFLHTILFMAAAAIRCHLRPFGHSARKLASSLIAPAAARASAASWSKRADKSALLSIDTTASTPRLDHVGRDLDLRRGIAFRHRVFRLLTRTARQSRREMRARATLASTARRRCSRATARTRTWWTCRLF